MDKKKLAASISTESSGVESLVKDLKDRQEFYYHDQSGEPVHLSKIFYKEKNKIIVFPYSYSRVAGLSQPKIKEIEFRGWGAQEDLPADFLSGKRIRLTAGRTKIFMRFLKIRFPKLEKLVISKVDKTKFLDKMAILNWTDMHRGLLIIDREKKLYGDRNKVFLANHLADKTNKILKEKLQWKDGALSAFLDSYEGGINLSAAEIDLLLSLITLGPKAKVTITTNFIETRDKINVAYLEDVMKEYDDLLKTPNDNEKQWQAFFEKNGWILNHLFPFEVILYAREAYVGGKTVHNADGKIVDFLYTNGFKDNYALLEIKTHNSALLKPKPYRGSDVFAMHDDLSGAINQCLDQKNVFMQEMGQKHRMADPKTILIIGRRGALSDNQRNCFELARANQKNVEITTYDELRQKIETLLKILKPEQLA